MWKREREREREYFAFDNRIEVLFDLPEGVYLFWKGLDHRFLGANDEFSRLVGVNAENILGKSYLDFIKNLCIAAKFQLNDEKVVEENIAKGFFEYAGYVSQKNACALSVKTPLEDSAGSVCGVLGVSFDLAKYNLEDVEKILKKFDIMQPQSKLLFPVMVIGGEEKLSKREQEFVLFLVKGMTVKEVAAKMGIAVRTAEGHMNKIKTKLNCVSKSKLMQKLVDQMYY